MNLTPVTIDFETYWSKTFSLSKQSFIEYIKSPEFEVISCAIKVGNAATQVVFGHDEVGAALRGIDWGNSICVAHNGNEFDFPLLVWTYDVHPKLFIDTLCMSRPKHQSEVGGSLKKLVDHYKLRTKDNTVLLQTQGKRLADFDTRELVSMANYNRDDTDNTYDLYRTFLKVDSYDGEDVRMAARRLKSRARELLLMDLTARAIVYPQFECDGKLLASTLVDAENAKRKLLLSVADVVDALDADEVAEMLGSAPKFAAVLTALGVPPPRKVSKTTGKETYAFAKTDEALLALLNHDDERVQTVVAARLGVKSTLLETRLAKMMLCGQLLGGKMSVPLAYHAATTGRWGGRVWNPQNLPRISRNKDGSAVPKMTNALRMSLVAPPGHKVVVSDLSGIELRVNHYLWNVESSMRLYAADPEADLYREFAAKMYRITPDAVTKDQRQLAKVAQLGLGFGAGAKTFQTIAKQMGGIDLDLVQAEEVVNTWRGTYRAIVLGWYNCQRLIDAIYTGRDYSPDSRGLVCAYGKERVYLPSGRLLYYPDLMLDQSNANGRQGGKYVYGAAKAGRRPHVYSGLMDENIVQAIARDVIAEQALTIKKETGYLPALMVHDELVYVVPEDKAEDHMTVVSQIMRQPPTWLPGIVLWSEGDIADSYGAAK